MKGDKREMAFTSPILHTSTVSVLLLFLPCLVQTLLIPRDSSDSQKYQHKALCPKNPKYFLKAATKLKAGLSSEAGNY